MSEATTKTGDKAMEEDFSFYTEEELLEMSQDINLAQKRTNKMMQISRLNRAIKAIVWKMGYDTEKAIKTSELRGDMVSNSLYDGYLLAKYERDAARKKLGEMPNVPIIASTIHCFFHEVQKEDPRFWREMKERAGARVAKINQNYLDLEKEAE